VFYLLVGPAHHCVPCCLERSCPYFITIGLITMNRPIDFNNQTPLWTAEIDDKAPERMLAREFEPLEPAITQMLPQPRFCQRLLASKVASANFDCLCCPSPLSHVSLFHKNVCSSPSCLLPS